MVALLAKPLLEQRMISIGRAAWYDKQCATFSDTIALVRRHLWATATLSMWEKLPDMIKIPRALLQHLTDTLSYVA